MNTADTGPLDEILSRKKRDTGPLAPPPPLPSRLLAILALTVFVKAAALGLVLTRYWDADWVSHLVQDIRTWRTFFEQAQAGLVPYVHFTKEYPVLGGLVYWVLSYFVEPGNLRQTVLAHGAFMGLADLVGVAVFYRLAREAAPRFATLATLFFALNPTTLVVAPVRFESVVVVFALLGLVFHRQRRFRLATLVWSIGCGLKWYPAFFIAAQEWRLFAREGRRAHWVGAAAIFVAATAAINLPFLFATLSVNGNLDNWTYPYLFHAQRPLYWDTVIGVGQIWLGAWPWERQAGIWTLALMLAMVLVRPGLGVETKGVLICLAAVLFNRIYSCQFNLWFYPFLLLTALRRPPRDRTWLLGAFVLLDLLNIVVFPFSFSPAVTEMGGFFPRAAAEKGGTWTFVFSAAILARAVLVAALGAFLLRRPDPEALDSAAPGKP